MRIGKETTMRFFHGWCATAAIALCLTSCCSSSSVGGSSGDPDGGAGPDLSVPAIFDVQPSTLQTISVNIGQTMPTVYYSATLDGQPASASWSVDRGDVGSIPPGPFSTGTFIPRGTTGGLVTMRASAGGQTVKRQILVLLAGTQNG